MKRDGFPLSQKRQILLKIYFKHSDIIKVMTKPDFARARETVRMCIQLNWLDINGISLYLILIRLYNG